MTKRTISFFLALALIIVAFSAIAESSSMTENSQNQPGGTDESPDLSVTLGNLNQVTEIVQNTGQSPTMSMTLGNLNQVTGTGQSPTMSMTLGNLNQVTGTNTAQVLSPTLSMTLNTLNRFSATIKGYGVSLNGLFTIQDTLTRDARAAFEAIAAYVGKGQAVIGYFDTDVTGLVLRGKLAPGYLGVDFSRLILSEYVSLSIHNTLETDIDITSTFGFASEYRDGQPVMAMFGYREKNGDIVWTALNTITVNGQVKVDIPSELLRRAGSEAILGILS
ncbi:MAG TPA: hypothetical protein PKU80_00385 [Candidatus Limiplasma sp.]|nr:hypothetical protein [Candidatus Limiplasma sp.]HRX08567.1 hypothetical protein [Candidatus Limiplasma sp.]